jgi:hypothetical protein
MNTDDPMLTLALVLSLLVVIDLCAAAVVAARAKAARPAPPTSIEVNQHVPDAARGTDDR